MKNKNLFKKIILIAFVIAVLLSLIAPAIFAQSFTAPKQEKLLNGLKVLMWSDNKADKVSLRLRIHSGSAFDPQGKEGVMQMLADNIFPEPGAREFFSEDLGGDLEILTNYDYIQVNASSKPENFLTMLETVATAVANPAIDKETTGKLRTALMLRVADLEADPAYVADQAIAGRLFGTFPYGRPQKGTAASLQRIDFADLIDAKQKFLTADNATLAVTGNFDRSLAFKAIRRYLGSWTKSDRRIPLTFRQPDPPQAAILAIQFPKASHEISRFAVRGPSRNEKDLGPSLVYAAVLEQRLRMRTSPAGAKDVFVRNQAQTLPGVIVVGLGSVGDQKVGLREIVVNAMANPVTTEEYQSARSSVQNLWAGKDAVTLWLDMDTYGTSSVESDSKTVEKVSLAEVNAYAERLRKLPMAAVTVNSTPAAN